MKIWSQILSELFINISSAWFVVAATDIPKLYITFTIANILGLLFKFILGILSLIGAQVLRASIRRKR